MLFNDAYVFFSGMYSKLLTLLTAILNIFATMTTRCLTIVGFGLLLFYLQCIYQKDQKVQTFSFNQILKFQLSPQSNYFP